GGDYYATGGVVDTLTDLRENTLRSYGIGEDLKKAFSRAAIARCRDSQNGPHMGRRFDANSLLALGGAMIRFDPKPQHASIRSKVVFDLSRTDAHFPPSSAPGVMASRRRAWTRVISRSTANMGTWRAVSMPPNGSPILRRFLSEIQTAT